MALALKTNWLDRFGSFRRRRAVVRAPIMASRDLPPLGLPLPRSPEPMPDDALVFARGAALRAVESADSGVDAPALPSVQGSDLRAMLERIEQAGRRRQALDQAAQARDRIVEALSAGKAGAGTRPTLQLVGRHALPPLHDDAADEDRIEQAMEAALASALGTLRQLSELPRR